MVKSLQNAGKYLLLTKLQAQKTATLPKNEHRNRYFLKT